MGERRVANPRLLLLVAALAAFLFSAVAIYFAIGYSPDTGRESDSRPTAQVTESPKPVR